MDPSPLVDPTWLSSRLTAMSRCSQCYRRQKLWSASCLRCLRRSQRCEYHYLLMTACACCQTVTSSWTAAYGRLFVITGFTAVCCIHPTVSQFDKLLTSKPVCHMLCCPFAHSFPSEERVWHLQPRWVSRCDPQPVYLQCMHSISCCILIC